MKLATCREKGSERAEFGLVIENKVISFNSINKKMGKEVFAHRDMLSYLQHLPASEDAARECSAWAEKHMDAFSNDEVHDTDAVRFLPPFYPVAMLDFGLSPRHLVNSAKTLFRHEYGILVQRLIGPLVKKKIMKMSRSGILPYYKCNHTSIIGDHDEMGWPAYTSYLDIEPELAIVTGTLDQPIAGYTILNDASARDVQMPEMTGMGPARAKDFSQGNGIGPFLVTPDEIADPMALEVTVKIGDRMSWKGSTSEYIATPSEVMKFISSVFQPRPGTIIGMGTIPDCTGLDSDRWICPGDRIEISFQGMGTLHQVVPSEISVTEPSRWKARKEFMVRGS